MNLTDDQIRESYRATGLTYDMTEHHLKQAKLFISAVFDRLTPAGYIDPDGTLHAEEWEASADCEPVFRRPE